MDKKVWFKAKKYGWGWSWPLTWQGWLVYLAFVAFVLWDFLRIDSHSHSDSDTLINYFPQLIVALIILSIICYIKGEKLKWRWGK